MNDKVELQATSTLHRGGASATIDTTVVEIGSYKRQGDGTFEKVDNTKTISVPEDERDTYKVFEVWTSVEEHGEQKFKPGVYLFGLKVERGKTKLISNFVCSPMYVTATMSDSDPKLQSDFGLRLKFYNMHKAWTEWSMPLELLADPPALRKVLYKHGVEIATDGITSLQRYLFSEGERQKNCLTCVDQLGWVNKNARTFVLPDKAYGIRPESYTFQSRAVAHAEYECAGTLAGWQAGVAARQSATRC
jgi:hypothetical protein